MTTYAAAAAQVNARAVYWLEISGIPYAFGDGIITDAAKATLLADAYTPTLTFYSLLANPPVAQTHSRSVTLLKGLVESGGLEVSLVDAATTDHPDGFLTWLFGAARSGSSGGIARTRLTADVGKAASGANWTVESTAATSTSPAFPAAPVDLYCGLETIRAVNAHGAAQLNNVTRSRWRSPAVAHRDNKAAIFPYVTDHPTQWMGRIVTLYQTYMDEDGALATATDATGARAAAFRMRGVLRDISFEDNQWSLRCESIDGLLDRQLMRGAAKARVSQSVQVKVGTFSEREDSGNGGANRGPVLKIDALDTNGAFVGRYYPVFIATGLYSAEQFIEALNEEFSAATLRDQAGNLNWVGQLSLSYADGELIANYLTDAAGANTRRLILNFNEFVFGEDDAGDWASDCRSLYWSRFGVTAVDLEVGGAATSTNYSSAIARNDAVEVDGRFRQTIVIEAGDDDSPIADFSASVGDADRVALVSTEGTQLFRVLDVDTINRSISIIPLPALTGSAGLLVHSGTTSEPIWIKRVAWLQTAFFAEGPLGSTTLRLLLSTGQAGYNSADYDTLPEGVGMEFPHMTPTAGVDATESLIDVASFEEFFADAEPYANSYLEVLVEPTPAKEWLAKRLEFLGGYLVIENGQLSVRRGISVMQHEVSQAITSGEMLPGNRSILTGQRATIDGIKWSWQVSWRSDKFLRTLTVLRGDLASDDAQNVVEYEDRAIRATDEQLVRLAQEILGDFGKENWIFSLSVDRARATLEPGQATQLSDEGDGEASNDMLSYRGLPNPDGGRGHSSTSCLVLSAETSHEEKRTDLRLIQTHRKRGGYAASAWISSFTNVGQAVLTCVANLFSPTEDGVDVSRFTAGDKVRILRVNPTQAGAEPGLQTSEAGLTIDSIDAAANTITLTGVLAVAWVSGTTPMVLVHDPYETASQTATAQNWCHAGDSSGDIDDGGAPNYEW